MFPPSIGRSATARPDFILNPTNATQRNAIRPLYEGRFMKRGKNRAKYFRSRAASTRRQLLIVNFKRR